MKIKMKSILSLNPMSITIGITFLVIVMFFWGTSILDLVELKTFDLRFFSRGVEKSSPEVVMAVIDEYSLDSEGRWPWARSRFAKLIDILSEDGAKVVTFDIFFTEPDQNANLIFIKELEKKIRTLKIKNETLDSFMKKNEIKADNDMALADAIKNSKAKVILGYFFHMSQAELDYEIDQKDIDKSLERVDSSKYALISYDQKEISPFIKVYAPESNIEILAQATDASGYVNMLPDRDGIVRWMPLILKCGQEIFTPLSIQTIWQYLDRPQLIVKVASYGIEGIQMGKTYIPTDENGQMLINYLGPTKTFKHYSIRNILHGKLPKGTFKDKIVLVGATATGIYDMRNTPFSPVFPGLEIHATVIDNILNNKILHKPKWTKIYDLLAILILGILTGMVIPRLSPLKGMLFAAGLFILHIIMSHWLFINTGLWVNMIYPLLTLVLVYIALVIYHYLVEEKNKRFLHATFSSYLSPELIEEMVGTETMPELGGEARTITAYFTDIESFSTFSEKLTAHQLVELLNEYLTAMTDILIAERGTLDKYEGDAIVAFLGAPMHITDHALRACRVAVDMQGILLELRKKWGDEKLLPGEPIRNTKNFPPEEWAPDDKWPKVVHNMRMRIGLNTGEIVVGNMGSSMRMNYTMMGDPVNLAARLEEGAKQFGIYTALSEYTMNAEYMDENGERGIVGDAVEARLIDRITVVGKSEPVKVYELCAMKGGLSDKEKKLFDVFDRGMRHYLNMEWDEAIARFKESLKIERIPDGKTTPSEVFMKRCEDFKENPPVPPGEKWDGVFRMTKK